MAAGIAGGPDREPLLRSCVEELESLHALQPNSGMIAMNLHWAYARLNETKKAAELANHFAQGKSASPQALAYFARIFSASASYDRALQLLERAPVLADYLGDELGQERMRALAGQGDVKGAIAAFARRIGELDADLDQLHFAYHVTVAMDAPSGEFPSLVERSAEMERELQALLQGADRRMVYVLMLAGLYSRMKNTDAQLELLLRNSNEFKSHFGFRHYLYRTAYRILESQEGDTPD